MIEDQEPVALDEILQGALARETEACEYYSRMALRCRIAYVRELLERLKDEESKHVHLIETMIARLNLGEDIV